MKSILVLLLLISVAFVITVVQGKLVSNDLIECERVSKVLAGRVVKVNKGLVKFIRNNCPTKTLIRYFAYVKDASDPSVVDHPVNGPFPTFRIYSDQREEQANWLAETEKKLSEYYSTLADLIESPQEDTDKTIEYPDISSISSILTEMDRNRGRNDFRANKYFWNHNNSEGAIKFHEALKRHDFDKIF